MKLYKSIIPLLWLSLFSQNLFASENWKIIISNNLKSDEAIKVALEDLNNAGLNSGIEFNIANESSQIEKNTILIGNENRNKVVKSLVAKNQIELINLAEKQSFQIKTTKIASQKVMVVSGGSIL